MAGKCLTHSDLMAGYSVEAYLILSGFTGVEACQGHLTPVGFTGKVK